MRPLTPLVSISCFTTLLFVAQSGNAGTNLVTKTSQGSGANWTAAIWQTNNGAGTDTGAGTSVAPVAGNTYTESATATAFGNNTGNTRTRNPTAGGLTTFPGDSLTLNTNTDIRFKTATGLICNFPGVGGAAGLVLNGGVLNDGDNAVITIAGKILAVPGTVSYICPGNNGGGAAADTGRAFTVPAQLTGSGTMVLFQGPTNNPNQFTCPTNTFSGRWIVKAGRLMGTAQNSLGTNSIIVDPNFVLPVPPFSSSAPVIDIPGPAVLEPSYTLNSAGILVLTNGGKLRLHQEVCFTAVSIHDPNLGINSNLSAGIHYFSELITNYPNNFDPGGSGAIVVQPFGTPPPLPPDIKAQPQPAIVYTNATARFFVTAADNGFPPLTYQWQRNGTNLTDGGNISGSTSSTLLVSSASPADAIGYNVIVANASYQVTSSIVSLSLTSANETYESAVVTAGPVALYQFNENADPLTNAEAFDFAGSYNGNYGVGAQNAFNGIGGPQAADGYAGFAQGNAAAAFTLAIPASQVAVPPWNLNTNTVTIAAWVNPNGGQNPNEALVFCRGGATVGGLCYASALGGSFLGYNWNDEPDTFNWSSGLIPPAGQWSLVALVVTPTNATVYVLNTAGLAASSHAYNHAVLPFEGTTLVGNDPAGTAGNRSFNGSIDDVAIFRRALSQSELLALYSAASGNSSFAPSIAVQPAAQTLFQAQTAQFTGLAIGSAPLTYQWQAAPVGSGGPYTNLTDSGQFSGSTTPTLTMKNIDFANVADYIVTVANGAGATASTPATLNILATNAPANITMAVQEPSGNDWDIGAPTAGSNTNWSDANPASYSAASSPGNTYEVLAGARLRSPDGPVITTFPGRRLTVDGDGVWNVNPAAGATIGEIRFKQHTYGRVSGIVNISQLAMNGGQLDVGNDGLLILGGGEIDILTNTPINNDSGNDRGYRIDSQLTGSAPIEYHGYAQATFMSAYSNNLNVACTSNTFSGQWSVVAGTLLGTGTNALGTNHIFVGTNGAVETTYALRNTNGYLVLNGTGKMFLHVPDVFRSVIVNGTGLVAGSNYTFATLNTMFPTNFPAVWTMQNGVTNSTGSGSILVLSNAVPLITTQPQSVTNRGQQTAQLRVVAAGGAPLSYQWRAGAVGSGVFTNVVNGGNISGATNNTLTITNLSAANAGDYVVVVTNSAGAATSVVAHITVISAPFIALQPLSQTNSGSLTAQFFVSSLGDLPLSYQWQAAAIGSGGPYTNVNNGGQFAGATTTNLTISNLAATNSADLLVIVSNSFGMATSAVATLTVIDPLITSQPQSLSRYQQATAVFSVGELGTPPLINRWQAAAPGSGGPYTNLTDGGKFSGTTTPTLRIANVDFDNSADYVLVLQNVSGVVTSSVANLSIQASSSAQNYTLDLGGLPIQQLAGNDWNTLGNWNPDGEAADVSAPARPGSTYTVVGGARLRTPVNGTNTIFSGGDYTPGIQLIVNGNGVFTNSPDANYPTNAQPLMGELRFKHGNPGTNYFRQLVMNGGQLDNADNGVLVLAGEIDILATTPFYVDSAAGQDRTYQIDSWLTGTGTIEWYQFSPALGGADLNITCPTNTFSGQWHVFAGALLGSGLNSLGTNNIMIEAGGALETLYDLNSPNANLMLNGQLFLHQNDTFRTVTIGGTSLAAGTYSFAQLTAAYPANFPSAWAAQNGSTAAAGSGSLTILSGPAAQSINVSAQVTGTNLVFSGINGLPNHTYYVLGSTNVTLPVTSWSRVATGSFDGSGGFSIAIPIDPAFAQRYFRLQQVVP
jgi:hypothetical protein